MRKCNLAVSLNAFARYSQTWALDALEELGFWRVELWGQVAHIHPGDLSEAEAEIMARRVRKRGFELASYMPEAPHLNLASGDALQREMALQGWKRCIRQCAAMEIPLMPLYPGYSPLDAAPDPAIRLCMDGVDALKTEAQGRGVELLLTHAEPPSLGAWETIVALSRALNMGVALDVSLAAARGSAQMERCLSEERVRMIRLSDGPGGHLAPGDGRIELVAVALAIHRAGMAERCVLTMDNRRNVMDPKAALRRCAQQFADW